jgi:protein-S-isoprenylcysteine O-methyltransferase Ste14
MKITGVAPKIAAPTFLYIIIAGLIDYWKRPVYNITNSNHTLLLVIGIIFILLGIIMVISAARKILASFRNNLLAKDGLFKIFRNPMYAAYLIFIIPGIAFILNSWLVLLAVLLNALLFIFLIKDEYKYLEEKFGDEYRQYLDKVFIKFL